MSENIFNDVADAYALIKSILSDGTTVVADVCCYDPAQGVSKSANLNIQGGAMLLQLNYYRGGHLLFLFMNAMKERGQITGKMCAHTKCLYLYYVHSIPSSEAQGDAIASLRMSVREYNEMLGTNWQVIEEKDGSAPI